MTTDKWGVLYCPKYRTGSRHKYWEKVKKTLADNGVDFDFVQSENENSVVRLVNMMINNGYKTIVIVGGDSALNDTVNCLMSVEKDVRDSIAVGVIPNGVMNDFAHYWGIKEGDIENTVAWMKKRRVRKIDLGCVRYTDSKDRKNSRYFLNCVNVGFIANVMNLRERTRRFFGSRTLSFLFSLLLLVFQRMEYKMRLKINSEVIRRKIMTVCVGNASGYGQTPNAVPYNGLLDVSVVYHPGITQVFEGFYYLMSGVFLNHKSVHPYRTREIVVEEARHALVSIDGRLVKKPVGSYKISVEQEVINFIIPD